MITQSTKDKLVIADDKSNRFYPADLNDTLKLSFKQIAQILRGNEIEFEQGGWNE